MQIEGRVVVFTAADGGDPFPFQHPVLLLGATSASKALAHLPAVALAHDRQWVEQVHVVRDDPEGWDAVGGRFVVRWSEEGAELVDVVGRAVVDRWQMQGRTVRHRSCPLIPDARPGDMCRLHGGPWVSMSILAAANWNDRRALFLDLVGCDEPCGNRRPRRGDRVPTRYTTWLSEAEFSQPEMHNDGHCRICMRVDCGHVGSVAVVDPPLGATVVRDAGGGQWLQEIAEPLVLSRGRIVEVGCAEDEVPFVLNRMILDDAGGSEDLLDWAHTSPAWPAMDADLGHRFRGLEFVHRWVCIGRFRVTGVRLGSTTVPIAFDLRRPQVLTSRVIARLGAFTLGEVHGWRLGHVQMVHGGRARADRAWGSDAHALAAWLREQRLAHLAAMFMEPLDPDGTLTLLDRQRYYDDLLAVLGSARLDVATEDLRRLLAGSGDYLRAQAALSDPRSDEQFWQAVHDHGQQVGTREVFRLA